MEWEAATATGNGRPLTLALPKGRLLPPALDLLRRAGFQGLPEDDSRRLLFTDPTGRLRLLILKPLDVPTYVEHGAADAGIVGKDVLLEQEPDVYEPLDLGFGVCRLVVAEPRELWERDDPAKWSWSASRPSIPTSRGGTSPSGASRLRWSGSTARSSWRPSWGSPSASWTSCSRGRRSGPMAWSRSPRSCSPRRG